jgi:MFS transporter, CP family, cyanate transporter
VAGILALAFNLRAAISSLPPVFLELSGSLHISVGIEAVLAAVPVLCFGVFSGFAAPLSRRFGEERVLGAALILLAAGLLLRGLWPRVMLFPGTVIASGAIALMNVLLPSLIKRRHPDQAGLLIGLYLLSLAAGAIVAALIAVPLFTAVADSGSAGAGSGNVAGAVRLTLGVWALPALAAAVVWVPQLRFRMLPRRTEPGAPGVPAVREAPGLPAVREAPGLPAVREALAVPGGHRLTRSALAWQVTAFMGLQSLTYYAALSWFPTLFRDRGVSAAHAGDLLAVMSLGNAFTALLMPVLAHRARDQRGLVAISVLITAAGMAGAAFGPLGTAAPLMFVLGLGQGATLGLSIFLFTARAPDAATSASLSGFAQAAGYLFASTGPLLIGFLHAVTGGWAIPVWALLAFTMLELVSGWLAGRDLKVPADSPRIHRASSRDRLNRLRRANVVSRRDRSSLSVRFSSTESSHHKYRAGQGPAKT